MTTPAQAVLDAVLAGDANRVAELLDRHPELCNLSERTTDRLSVLHHAARLGHLPVVEVLLVAGATVNKRDHAGFTPLHWAALCGHLEVSRALVVAGADLYARANGGWSPWDNAQAGQHREVMEFLRQQRRND